MREIICKLKLKAAQKIFLNPESSRGQVGVGGPALCDHKVILFYFCSHTVARRQPQATEPIACAGLSQQIRATTRRSECLKEY